MKHIKTYKLFESNEIEIRDYLSDIFLELKDKEFDVEIEGRWIRTSGSDRFVDEKHTGYEIKIKKNFTEFPIKTFLLEDVYDSILRCKSYLKEIGFFISDIRVSALNRYNTPESYGLDYSIGLHESNPEKYKLFDKSLTFLEFKIRKNM